MLVTLAGIVTDRNDVLPSNANAFSLMCVTPSGIVKVSASPAYPVTMTIFNLGLMEYFNPKPSNSVLSSA